MSGLKSETPDLDLRLTHLIGDADVFVLERFLYAWSQPPFWMDEVVFKKYS